MQGQINAIIIFSMGDFIREQIKEKPLSKKKIAIKIGISALCGLVFALVACIIFAIFLPIIYKQNQGGEVVADGIDSESEFMTEIPIDTEDETDTEVETEIEDETEADTVKEPEVIVKEYTIDDYQKVQNQLYEIGSEANKSVVSITSVQSDTDWFNNTYDTSGTSAGVIVSTKSDSVLIISEKKAISNAKHISVTFFNDDAGEATLVQYDGNTGLAVLAVDKAALQSETLDLIEEARFANSNMVSKGMLTIAIGSPLGTTFSILAGTITSTDNEISTVDRNYKILTTDIVATPSSRGVLINSAGYVIGIITQEPSARENTITAIGISDMVPVIDMLAEGRAIPYLGLYVTTVTDEISEEYDLPKGVYIKETSMDSPAMLAGIQSGDVLVEIDGEEIKNVTDYFNKILEMDTEKQYKITIMRQGSDGYTRVKCQVTPDVLK